MYVIRKVSASIYKMYVPTQVNNLLPVSFKPVATRQHEIQASRDTITDSSRRENGEKRVRLWRRFSGK